MCGNRPGARLGGGGGQVHVEAKVDGRTEAGEAWMRADAKTDAGQPEHPAGG
jgi:hypothetical protein